MIRAIRIDSFKRFANLELAFAPLTVLTGMNGSGKSTVIQSLLLSKSAGQSSGEDVPLANAEYGMNLGEAVDVLHYQAESTSVIFEIEADESFRLDLELDSENQSGFVRRSSMSGPMPVALQELIYLGAERTGPRISQPNSSVGESERSVGHDGRYTASVLASSARLEVPPGLRHPDATTPMLGAQAEAWLSQIVGRVQVQAAAISRTDIATLQVRHGNLEEWLLPTNTGFGISYILPIVVAALASRPGALLVVDSPEAHMHPAAQSAIGGFLFAMAAGGLQILVETHSDHVVNGIRVAVAQSESNGRALPLFHFFSGDEPETIAVGANGSLDHWPAGFFDQAQVDLLTIARRK